MQVIRYQLLTAALMSAFSATPVAAQNTPFPVPEGCTAFLTVQSRSCLVAHYWQCNADPAGTHWRATLDQDGAFYLNYTDNEFRWLRSFDLRSGRADTLIEPEDDPASLSTLLDTGRDTMAFSIRAELQGSVFQRDYTGYDALTGARVTIDGEELLVTEFAYQWQAEAGPRSTQGNQFVSRERGLFFGGLETVTTPSGEVFEGNYSPMEFAEPGEAGFLSTVPRYDCGDMMSGLVVPHVERVSQ